MNRLFGKVLLRALALVILVALVAWAASFLGVYNVAADDPHWPIVKNFLGSTMDHSVAARDGDIVVPDLKDAKMIAAGAAEYDSMCTACHLSPGLEENKLRAGLYPKPPSFARRRWPGNPKEQFWIIKHGIKMSAMPAWGKTLEDADIWDLVSFIRKMPDMSAENYLQFSAP